MPPACGRRPTWSGFRSRRERTSSAGARTAWAVPRERVAEIVATTGTTGEPLYVAMTRSDLERLGENERRGFLWLGARPGDRFHIAITLDNLFVAGLAYHLGLAMVGATAIRVGAQPVRRHLDLMKQLRPAGLVAVPSLLLALARRAQPTAKISPPSLLGAPC